jgi:signal transduction histidine kinase/ActR/RegA family two-component response regulator
VELKILLFLGPDLRQEVEDWFQRQDVPAASARDFADCVEKVRRGGGDVIFADRASMEAGGGGAVADLRVANPGIFIVLVRPSAERASGDDGATDAAISLPLERRELDGILERAAKALNDNLRAAEQVEIRELWEISKALASNRSTTDLLEQIIDSALRVTGAESGSVMLVTEEEETLYVAAARGKGAEFRRRKLVIRDQSVAGWVARTGEPLLLQGSLAGDERFTHLSSRSHIRSSLCVPMVSIQGSRLGVLSLNMEEKTDFFTQQDLHLMTVYASEAAAIVESAQAFDRLQSTNAQLLRMNERLKAIQAQLVQSSKMAAVGLLASGIAHEFNNLLTGILGMAQLARQTGKEKHLLKSLEVSEDNSQKAKEIIKNLLKFSGRYKKVREKTDMGALVDEVLSLMSRELEKEGITIQKDYGTGCVAPVNRSEIQQVILNLLINAKQAIQGPGQVEIQTARSEGSVEIHVRDTGCGIAEENIARIFEPFFSTKSVLGGGDNPESGTGLGLSVSYGIVQSHGGDIEVQSRTGKGSTFIVRLPKIPQRTRSYTDSYPVQTEDGERAEPAVPIDADRKTILVIDDEWWIREFLRETFEEMGYRTVTAEGGVQGFQLIGEHRPFMVFLDLVMPDVRGEDLARRIIEDYPNLNLVLMTGKFESLDTIEKNIEAGVFAYLSKPFDVKDVINVLNLDAPPS